MTSSGFVKSMPHVLAYEGGKVDDPHDPGGRTNQGVTQRTYTAWRVASGHPDRDVYKMTNAERDAIYRKQYWDAVKGDELPAGVDFAVFDGAVNSGPKQSVLWLQRAVGVKADGVLGMMTLAAVLDYGSDADLIDAICDRRMAFLQALRTWPRFKNGWTTRVAKVRATAKAMISGPVAVGVVRTAAKGVASAKAYVGDAHKAPGKGIADTTAGVGGSALGVGGTLNQLQERLTPFSLAGNVWLDRLIIILIIAGAVLLVGGLVWRWYAVRQKAKLVDALDEEPEVKLL